uniref:Uncharacterized protein n=1 Tax=Anguilla anguilla TaxID=7936 RepID=A0A0E9WAM7_ANGAN
MFHRQPGPRPTQEQTVLLGGRILDSNGAV